MTTVLEDLTHLAALICTAAGVVSALAVLVVTRDARAALPVALELWLAAGLLGLSGTADWRTILVAAAIIAIRQVVRWGLHRTSVAAVDVHPLRNTDRWDTSDSLGRQEPA